MTQAGIRYTSRAFRAAKDRVPSRRQSMDEQIKAKLQALHTKDEKGRMAPESMYGVRKMWVWLKTNGFPNVARCTVERLMQELGYQGLRRGKAQVTTRRGKDKKAAEVESRRVV